MDGIVEGVLGERNSVLESLLDVREDIILAGEAIEKGLGCFLGFGGNLVGESLVRDHKGGGEGRKRQESCDPHAEVVEVEMGLRAGQAKRWIMYEEEGTYT